MKKISIITLMISLALASAAITVAAQSSEHAKPKDLQVVDDVPVPSKELIPKQEKPKLETKRVVKKGDDTVEEYRINGKLFKMRVVPAVGPAYYLHDPKGDGKFIRTDGPDLKIATPMWVLLEW